AVRGVPTGWRGGGGGFPPPLIDGTKKWSKEGREKKAAPPMIPAVNSLSEAVNCCVPFTKPVSVEPFASRRSVTNVPVENVNDLVARVIGELPARFPISRRFPVCSAKK